MPKFIPEAGATVWVVTRERVRAGKAPFAVRVYALVYATSQGVRAPCGVSTDRGAYYSLTSLWPSREGAVRATHTFAGFEQEAADEKYRLITARLNAARNCT